MEGVAQTNVLLTSSNSVVMEKLTQMTATMNTMQAQLKTLSTTPTNPTRTKRKINVGAVEAIHSWE